MRAVRVHRPGGPEVFRIEATGPLTRRRAPARTPRRCVGEVDHPGGTELVAGRRVAAVMGEMGRAYDGGCAEYRCDLELVANALEKGVAILPLSYHYGGDGARAGFLIGYGAIPTTRIEEGLFRLGSCI